VVGGDGYCREQVRETLKELGLSKNSANEMVKVSESEGGGKVGAFASLHPENVSAAFVAV